MNKLVMQIMSQLVLSTRTVNIKLLEDSITHGEGGTGFKQNGELIIEDFARNNDGYCWANLFKEYMENKFNCNVINNACCGIKTDFIIDNFEKLVDENDDIIICVIGTNNRNQVLRDAPKHSKEEHMTIFYNDIIKLHNKFREANKNVIFVANIPAAAENEKDNERLWRVFHMDDVNNIYMKASIECGFPLISLYIRFLEYCELKEICVDDLLADGLHPNDKGHEVIFKLILHELGVGRSMKY